MDTWFGKELASGLDFGFRLSALNWPLWHFCDGPLGPLGSGPPRAGYSQRRKRKEKGERAALIFLPRPV